MEVLAFFCAFLGGWVAGHFDDDFGHLWYLIPAVVSGVIFGFLWAMGH